MKTSRDHKLWIHRYELEPVDERRALRKGFLLKVEGQDFKAGYSDCMTWPELGDPSLEVLVATLSESSEPSVLPTLSARCLFRAIEDGIARESKTFLLNEQHRLQHHLLTTDVASLSADDLEALVEKGFHSLKIKVGPEPSKEFESFLRRMGDASVAPRLRLDFNGGLTESWIPALKEARAFTEFLEDPYPEVGPSWGTLKGALGIPLARDFAVMDQAELSEYFEYYVCKPAREATEDLLGLRSAHEVVFTSYLGHPVGQASDSVQAIRAQAFDTDCGILSHHFYKPNQFSKTFPEKGSRLEVPGQFGIGFDSLLEALPWTPLF